MDTFPTPDNDVVVQEPRVMHTYRVTLRSPEQTTTELVNLSYRVNEDLVPIDGAGQVVQAPSIQTRIEVMKRLRKLADRSAVTVTPAEIEEADWDIDLVRRSFVTVAVDGVGRPIPRRRSARLSPGA